MTLPITELEPAHSITRALWFRLCVYVALIGAAVYATVLGVQLRRNAYLWTEESHYYGDAYNAFRYGYFAVKYPPLFDFPETIYKGVPEYTQKKFDYPPLRLTVSYLYAKWMDKNFPGVQVLPHFQNFIMIEPMLNLNTATEFISAIFVFLLIRLWTIRADDAGRLMDEPPRPFRGVFQGFIGAMLFWFNPAIIIDAHAWPQWDVWFFPFVLGAMLLASVDAWLLAGALLAIGALFKGQVLVAIPIFIFWPLFRMNFGAILGFVGGFAFAAAAAVLPWMRPTTPALLWICLTGTALILVMLLSFYRRKLHWGWYVGLAAITFLLVWPWQSHASISIRLLPPAIVGLFVLMRFLPRRMTIAAFTLCMGVTTFLIIPLFNGKTYWYEVAYEYGSKKFMTMAVVGTHNLPSILVSYFRIGGAGEGNPLITMNVPLLGDVVIRNFLIGLNAACAILCGIGAAMHSRKPDKRMLLALVTPMLCAFVILPQLNNRYAVWAAGLSALLAGVSVELSLLGVLISVIAWAGMAQLMYTTPGMPTEWSVYLPPLRTHLGWIMILSAAIYLYMIFFPTKRAARLSSI